MTFEHSLGKFYLRAANDDDWPGIIDCIRSVNGDLYYNRNMYDPGYMRRTAAQGNLKMFAASGGDDRIYSIIALTKNHFDTSPRTFSTFITRPEANGIGLGTALHSYALDNMRRSGIISFNAFPLTTHTVSQHIAEGFGFTPTGYAFGVSDERVVTPDPNVRSQKRTLAAYTLAGAKRGAGELFVPERISRFAEETYKKLGVTVIINNTYSQLTDDTQWESIYDSLHYVTHVKISYCGTDLPDILMKLSHERSARLDTIDLLLNCSNPSAVGGFSRLISHGYMFAGFSPLSDDGEYIIMFHNGAAKICFDEIRSTPLAKQVLDYILFRSEV